MGGGSHPNERRAAAKANHVRKTLRVQCGEDGAGRRKSGSIAYRATSVWHSGGLESDDVGG